ncbi:hypothetical protein IJI00_01845 [Candidatus Saccharibacteria bacterium]|nr:hypothetical protein [Candidatus Saccharibacteria bacterium]
MKKAIIVLSLIATFFLGAISVGTATAYNYVDSVSLKDHFHAAAEIYRDANIAEKSAFVKINQRGWDMADGKDMAKCYFYDATDGQKYYLTPDIIGSYYSDGGNTSNGIAFRYSGYIWYQTQSGTFYRRSGTSQIWATAAENDRILKNGTYLGNTYYDDYGGKEKDNKNDNTKYKNAWTERNANLSSSNYSYSGVKLYAGRIYGVETAASRSDAEYLARFGRSLNPSGNYKSLADTYWNIMNAKGSDTFANLIQYYPDYKSNAKFSEDDVKLAYEIFFRIEARSSGIANCGQTLPSNYCFYYKDSSGNLYYRSVKDNASTNYTFPYRDTAGNVNRSPY